MRLFGRASDSPEPGRDGVGGSSHNPHWITAETRARRGQYKAHTAATPPRRIRDTRGPTIDLTMVNKTVPVSTTGVEGLAKPYTSPHTVYSLTSIVIQTLCRHLLQQRVHRSPAAYGTRVAHEPPSPKPQEFCHLTRFFPSCIYPHSMSLNEPADAGNYVGNELSSSSSPFCLSCHTRGKKLKIIREKVIVGPRLGSSYEAFGESKVNRKAK